MPETQTHIEKVVESPFGIHIYSYERGGDQLELRWLFGAVIGYRQISRGKNKGKWKTQQLSPEEFAHRYPELTEEVFQQTGVQIVSPV